MIKPRSTPSPLNLSLIPPTSHNTNINHHPPPPPRPFQLFCATHPQPGTTCSHHCTCTTNGNPICTDTQNCVLLCRCIPLNPPEPPPPPTPTSHKRLRDPPPRFQVSCAPHPVLGPACAEYCTCDARGEVECLLAYGCRSLCNCTPGPASPPAPPPSPSSSSPRSPPRKKLRLPAPGPVARETAPVAPVVPWEPFGLFR